MPVYNGPNPSSENRSSEFEGLIESIVERTISRFLESQSTTPPYISSRQCAELLGVTAEHLCAMRARGDGPPWSGAGKWIRYRRSTVLHWLDNLPRAAPAFDSPPILPTPQPVNEDIGTQSSMASCSPNANADGVSAYKTSLIQQER